MFLIVSVSRPKWHGDRAFVDVIVDLDVIVVVNVDGDGDVNLNERL